MSSLFWRAKRARWLAKWPKLPREQKHTCGQLRFCFERFWIYCRYVFEMADKIHSGFSLEWFFFHSFISHLLVRLLSRTMCQQQPALQSVVLLAFVASPKRRRTQFTCDFKCEMIQIDFFFLYVYVRATVTAACFALGLRRLLSDAKWSVTRYFTICRFAAKKWKRKKIGFSKILR